MEDAQPHWILQIPLSRSLIVLLCIIYCIAPPYIALYYTNRDFLVKTDFFKVLLFVSSIGLLLFSIMFIWFYFFFMFIKTVITVHKGKKMGAKWVQDTGKMLGFKTEEFIAGMVIFSYTVMLLQVVWSSELDTTIKNEISRLSSVHLIFTIMGTLILLLLTIIFHSQTTILTIESTDDQTLPTEETNQE